MSGSLYDGEFANIGPRDPSIDMVDIESRGDIKVVFRAEVPRHKTTSGSIMNERIHQFSPDGEDPDRTPLPDVPELQSSLATPFVAEVRRFKTCRANLRIRHYIWVFVDRCLRGIGADKL